MAKVEVALFLNGHGGNLDPMRVALRRLDVAFPGCVLTGATNWDLAEAELAALCIGPRNSAGHACEIETALMLYLRPEPVRSDRIADDPSEIPAVLRGLTWTRDFGRRTDHGAIGYPERASAESGRRMLEAVVARRRRGTRDPGDPGVGQALACPPEIGPRRARIVLKGGPGPAVMQGRTPVFAAPGNRVPEPSIQRRSTWYCSSPARWRDSPCDPVSGTCRPCSP